MDGYFRVRFEKRRLKRFKQQGALYFFVIIFLAGCVDSTTTGGEIGHSLGLDCYSCHVTPGSGFGSGIYEEYSAAGTVYVDKAGSQAASGAVIRAVASGTESYVEALSDSLGNFTLRGLDTAEVYDFTITYGGGFSSSAGSTMGQKSPVDGYISCNYCHEAESRLSP